MTAPEAEYARYARYAIRINVGPAPPASGETYRITPEVLERICTFVRAGVTTPRRAAIAAGCPAMTFDEAVARGRGTDQRPSTPWFREIVARLEEAVAQGAAQAEIEAKKLAPWRWLAAVERGSWIETARVEMVKPDDEITIRVQYVDVDGTVTSDRTFTTPRDRMVNPLARLRNGVGHLNAGPSAGGG
jgi:hypothetical protein